MTELTRIVRTIVVDGVPRRQGYLIPRRCPRCGGGWYDPVDDAQPQIRCLQCGEVRYLPRPPRRPRGAYTVGPPPPRIGDLVFPNDVALQVLNVGGGMPATRKGGPHPGAGHGGADSARNARIGELAGEGLTAREVAARLSAENPAWSLSVGAVRVVLHRRRRAGC